LSQTDFKNKLILEVGSGNGRFTELFLKYGAKVIAIDYSTAIDANLKNHMKYFQEGVFLPLQADLFEIPLARASFDMVFCYGVIHHTGDNLRALKSIAKYVKKDGKLFVDIYAVSLIHYNPFIYLMRFILQIFKISDLARLEFVKSFIKFIFPIQVYVLTYLYKKRGILKYIRYIINRSPNSVYGINLWLDGKITKKCAYDWCIMDTFDSCAPKHDHPVTIRQWNDLLDSIVDMGFLIENVGSSGQGYTAIMRKCILDEK
jgi:SAM-dependent methyltransferase